eukprot:jgi/Chrzof1/14534/Cz09g06120.t1
MNETRRLAYVSAVNIDGAEFNKINRSSDPFDLDPRLPESKQCGEWLYTDNDLDRGHLTRRQDPNWGSDADAQAANRDTFYFPNIAPQHNTLNTKKEFWLGLEDYILDNTKLEGIRACVFNGPVFKNNDPVYRGLQIPLEFWKVVVVYDEAAGMLRSSAYVLSQKELVRPLIADSPEEELPVGKFRTFQTTVSRVEQLTGLLWDAVVHQSDVLAATEMMETEAGVGELELMSPADIIL